MANEVEEKPEVEQTSDEEVKEEEKETLSEPSADEKPVEETVEEESTETLNEDTGDLETQKQLQGLKEEREKLLKEIVDLRGQRRQIKDQEVQQAIEKKEEQSDLNPQDIDVFKKIAKATGYVSQVELDKKFYNEVKQDELNKFLDKYPEYKPENDPQDIKWSTFQNELQWFRMPNNPRQVMQLLEKVHKSLSSPTSDKSAESVKQAQMKTASIGSGGKPSGTKSSSSLSSFDQDKVWSLRSGGYSDEEIIKILNKLE